MWEKARVGRYERIALKHEYYHMEHRWPVQVQFMKQVHSKLMLWDNPEGWGGEFRTWRQMCTHDWFMSMYVKNHHNTVIILQLKKKAAYSLYLY